MSLASRRRAAWLAWCCVVVACGVGLRWYRIDNAIDCWAPDKAPLGDAHPYVVVGGPADAFARVSSELRSLAAVGRVLDPMDVALLHPFGGPTADRFVINGDWAGGFYFAQDDASAADLLEAVHAVADREPSVRIAGPAAYDVGINAASQARMPQIAAAIAAIGFVGVRLCGFGWRVAASASAVVVGAQVALLGAMSWLGVAVDATASMAPPLMAALGYSLVLHRAGGAGDGLLLGCFATTAAAAASVAVAPVGPLRQFGLVSLGGLTLVTVGTWLLVNGGGPLPRSCAILGRGSKVAWLAAVGAIVVGILATPRLHVNADGLALLPSASRERAAFEALDSRLTGMLPSQFIAEPASPELAAELEWSPAVVKVVDTSRVDGLPPGSRLWVLAHNNGLRDLAAMAAKLRVSAVASGSTVGWHGLAAQLAEAEEQVASVAIAALPTALAVTAAAAWIASRSFRAALAACLVAALPSAVLIATLAAFGVPLTPPHLLVFAVATGVAADDLLHVCRAWATDADAGWRHACLASSAVSVACLLPLLASPFPPARQFAWMLALALTVASAAGVFLFPRMLPSRKAHCDIA